MWDCMQSPALLKRAQMAQQGSKSTAEVYVSYYLMTADCISLFKEQQSWLKRKRLSTCQNTAILEKDNFCLHFSTFLCVKPIGCNSAFLKKKKDDPWYNWVELKIISLKHKQDIIMKGTERWLARYRGESSSMNWKGHFSTPSSSLDLESLWLTAYTTVLHATCRKSCLSERRWKEISVYGLTCHPIN